MEKKELIARLEEISELFCKARSLKKQMDHLIPQDTYERKISVPPFPDGLPNSWIHVVNYEKTTSESAAVRAMGEAYDDAFEPSKPKKPSIGSYPKKQTTLYDDQKGNRGCLFWVGLFFGSASLFFLLTGRAEGMLAAVIAYLVIIALCALPIVLYYTKLAAAKVKDAENTKKAIADYERDKKEKEEKYLQRMSKYEKDIAAYAKKKAAFLEKYVEWRKVYVVHLAEEKEIAEKLEADRVAAVEKIAAEQYRPTLEKLSARNDLVAKEYLPVLDEIIALLRSGRADDLKEAINLYEEIQHREKQLKMQEEQEEQRRYEEKMRREAEERHHREEMRQRERQEEQRRYEEDRRHREEMRFREEQERQRRREAEQQLEAQRRIERELKNRK